MRQSVFLSITLFSILLAGCAQSDDFTMASSKQVLLNIDKSQSHGVQGGSSPRWIFLMIPFGLPSVAEATDDALNKGNGNLLVDATVFDRMVWYLPLILGRQSYVVKGEVYQVKEPLRYSERSQSTETTIHKYEREGKQP